MTYIVIFHSAYRKRREQQVQDWRSPQAMDKAVQRAYPELSLGAINNLPRYTVLTDRGLFVTGG